MTISSYDYVLVGGGLQSSLIALALLSARPGVTVAMIERDPRPGGNHTWSFHGGDVSREAARWLDPLVVARWPAYDVRFPGFTRTLRSPYASITSERLAAVIEGALSASGCALLTGAEAVSMDAQSVTLADGRKLCGGVVVDARGPVDPPQQSAGYQKFYGVEVELERGEVERPLLMDATVPQRDGFRFIYVLPFTPTRVLVEDTYFADGPELDGDSLRDRALAYAGGLGTVRAVLREEHGVLPMPWRTAGTGAAAPLPGEPLRAGYRGGWFHPATGYSLPVAVRLASVVAAHKPEELASEVAALAREHQAQVRFTHLLNWLAFRCVVPGERWRVYCRAYRLPEDVLERFYALATTRADRVRFFCGRPPGGLSLRRALRGAARDHVSHSAAHHAQEAGS